MSEGLWVVIGIVLGIASGVLIGAAAAALVLPFRHHWQRSATLRVGLSGLIALLAFAIAFAGLTRLFVEAVYRVFSGEFAGYLERAAPGSRERALLDYWGAARAGIVRELWARQLMPPSGAGRCYTERAVCDYLNNDLALALEQPWGMYAIYLSFAGLAAVAAVLLAWRFGGRPVERRSTAVTDEEEEETV